MEKQFKTIDLQIATFLYVKGLDYIAIIPSEEKPQLKEFVFPKEEAEGLLEDFNNGATVPAISLFKAYHKLRLLIMPPKRNSFIGGGT